MCILGSVLVLGVLNLPAKLYQLTHLLLKMLTLSNRTLHSVVNVGDSLMTKSLNIFFTQV